MSDNSTRDYNEYVRANLPPSMTYNSDVDRYQIKSHSFFKFKNSNWYYRYITKFGYVSFDPSFLFRDNEPGIWLDPSDLTTMFQDAAGTTPVTTPGQSVRLRLDKSQGLVLGPELVTNGTFDTDTTGWTTNSGASISAVGGRLRLEAVSSTSSSVRAGDNFTTEVGKVYRFVMGNTYIGTGATLPNFTVRTGHAIGSGGYLTPFTKVPGEYVFVATSTQAHIELFSGTDAIGEYSEFDNVSVKELPGNHALATSDTTRGIYGVEPFGGRRNLLLNTDTLATQSRTVTAVEHTLSFRGTGTVTLTGASIAGPLIGTGADDIVSLTFTPTAGSLTLTVLGTVNDAQLEIGDARSGYQLVGSSAFDVTEAGVQSVHYVQYDGVDDFYVTPTITPGTDKVQVFAGVRKLSDAAGAVLAEHSASLGSNNGSFVVFAPTAANDRYGFNSKGTLAGVTFGAGFPAPITNVLTGIGDISGDLATLRIDGTEAATSAIDQGTGNYLAYPLYIGRRAGTSLPFNGRDYGLIVRFGDNLDTSTITSTETWLADKTGVTL